MDKNKPVNEKVRRITKVAKENVKKIQQGANKKYVELIGPKFVLISERIEQIKNH